MEPGEQHVALVEALRRPEAYPEHPAAVEMVETHVSWLFFTGRHVYKVKKPVDFGFLDFTTLERRRHFCHREVELNRRLAPSVYLGVVEVRQHSDRVAVEGPGRTVEYAVKMRQLPRERSMQALLQRGELTAEHVRAVARLVGRFHLQAATGPEVVRHGGWGAVRFNVEENFSQTEPYVGRTLDADTYDEVRASSEAFLEVRRERFQAREAQGWVRDGHGDLHTAQVFLEDGTPQVIDCIEFNERFRYADVAADIAFLLMDLEFHGRPDLAQVLLEEYLAVTQDPGLVEFLDFYKGYRAYVRGKVTGFLMDDPRVPPGEREALRATAGRYFALARAYAQAARPRPALYVVMGLSGTGKTLVARELARRWGLTYLASDVVRKELAGIPATEHRWEPYGRGIYGPEMSARTYAEVARRAEGRLQEGDAVVVDATCRLAAQRAELLGAARRAGAPVYVVHCRTPEEEVRERLEARVREGATPSDGRWEIYLGQKGEFEAPAEVPPGALVELDTTGTPREVLARLLRALYGRFLA